MPDRGNSLSLRESGAGDEARARNFQLANKDYRSFTFTTYKTAQGKSTCMQRIPWCTARFAHSRGTSGGRFLSHEILDRIARLTQVPLAALCDKVRPSMPDHSTLMKFFYFKGQRTLQSVTGAGAWRSGLVAASTLAGLFSLPVCAQQAYQQQADQATPVVVQP